MKADRQLAAKQTSQLGGATHVIEMTVGVENHRRAETGGAHTVDDLLRLLTGIDDHELARFGISKQYTIRLNRTDRKNVEEQSCRHDYLSSFANSEF